MLYLLTLGKQPIDRLFDSAASPVASWLEIDQETLSEHWEEAGELGRDMDALLA